MSKVKNKIYDWKDRLRKGKMLTLVVTLITIIIILGVYALIKARDYRMLAENSYNQAFYELTEYLNTTEELLKKATISNSSTHASKILTTIWRTTALAQSDLARIPIEVKDLENTNKFLSQVSDYSYTLSKKCFEGNNLSNSDLDNLEKLHEYSVNLRETINQLNDDLYSGNIRWGQLSKKGNKAFLQEENISKTTFSNIEEDLHQYTGLIYDGAYSENQNNYKGVGLTGDDVTEEKALQNAKDFIGDDRIENISSAGESQNGRIPCYTFNVKFQNNQDGNITVSKKGGHVIQFNGNRDVRDVSISEADAINSAKQFLSKRNLNNMKETYYLKENNVLTVNLAYTQDNIIIYPDLIKVKVALDNGEVLGIEATNYYNSHKEKREIAKAKISKEDALKSVNPKLEISSVDMAIIPTEWGTENYCYEIKGRIKNNNTNNTDNSNDNNNNTGRDNNNSDNNNNGNNANNESNDGNSNKENNNENNEVEGNEENDFLVYINAETGKEEDILMIVNTPNGTLTT